MNKFIKSLPEMTDWHRKKVISFYNRFNHLLTFTGVIAHHEDNVRIDFKYLDESFNFYFQQDYKLTLISCDFRNGSGCSIKDFIPDFITTRNKILKTISTKMGDREERKEYASVLAIIQEYEKISQYIKAEDKREKEWKERKAYLKKIKISSGKVEDYTLQLYIHQLSVEKIHKLVEFWEELQEE